jgi:5-methylcytosine-specific restriction endonuclease McrA
MSQSAYPPYTELFVALWTRQSGDCALCAKPMPETRNSVAHATLWTKYRPTFDHIRAVSCGGKDVAENLRLAHALCNKRRGRGLK